MGRLGKTEEIAALCTFLASDEVTTPLLCCMGNTEPDSKYTVMLSDLCVRFD